MHLLRMMKKAINYDELIRSEKYVSFNRIDGATVFENDKPTEITMNEFDDYFYKKLYILPSKRKEKLLSQPLF